MSASRLREQRVPVGELIAGAIAGRGIRLPSGDRVPMGTPLTAAHVDGLRSAGGEVAILSGDALRGDWATSPVAQTRAAILQAVFRANLRSRPPESRARNAGHGRMSVIALQTAFATAAWFAPAADIILAHGLRPGFLGDAGEVALLAGVTGAALGWDEDVLADLALAAFLADVGMLLIPAQLATKPGRLSRLERREMESHVARGAELLAPLSQIAPLVPVVAEQHHERVDGSGYPSGRSGRDVRPETQVIAVAQRYLAAISDRPYRPALPPHEAIDVVAAEAGRLAAPSVVEAFAGAIETYHPGSWVRLSDGSSGVVDRAGAAGKPVVTVLNSATGEPVEPTEKDLSASQSISIVAGGYAGG